PADRRVVRAPRSLAAVGADRGRSLDGVDVRRSRPGGVQRAGHRRLLMAASLRLAVLSIRSKRSLKKDRRMTAEETRDRIVEATLTVLKRHGYAGASARSIAAEGGFDPALIFYQFGSVRNVLLATLDRTSADRMAAYRAAVAGADDIPALVAVAG